MHDWSTLLTHANEAASTQTWALPPDDLFQRILAQVRALRLPCEYVPQKCLISVVALAVACEDQPFEARHFAREVQCLLEPKLFCADAFGVHPRLEAHC